MSEPRAPRFDRRQLVRSYLISLAVLLLPTLAVLNSPYGSLVFPIYFIVFVLGVTNYLRDDLIEKTKGLAGLLGCGTVLLLLIPFVIVLYMTQA